MWGQSYDLVSSSCPRPLHLGSIHPIIGSAISRCSLHNPYFKRVLQADSSPSSLCLVPPHFLISFSSLHPTTCPITGAPNHLSPLYSLIHISQSQPYSGCTPKLLLPTKFRPWSSSSGCFCRVTSPWRVAFYSATAFITATSLSPSSSKHVFVFTYIHVE